MGSLKAMVGKVILRLGKEGIHDETALYAAVREIRRALEDSRVPPWLAGDISDNLLTSCREHRVLRQRFPVVALWRRFLTVLSDVLQVPPAEVPLREDGEQRIRVFWYLGEKPSRIVRLLEGRVELHHVEEVTTEHRIPDERLLVVPARAALDLIPDIRRIAEDFVLTGLILEGRSRDSALLVLAPTTGIPVRWLLLGNDLLPNEAGLALRIILGPLSRPGTVFARALGWKHPRRRRGSLEEIHRVLGNMSQIPWWGFLLDRYPGWRPGELERQLEISRALLSAMSPDERQRPEAIGPERRRALARKAGASSRFVEWFLGIRDPESPA